MSLNVFINWELQQPSPDAAKRLDSYSMDAIPFGPETQLLRSLKALTCGSLIAGVGR